VQINPAIIIAVVVVVGAVVVVAILLAQRRKTLDLQRRFGSEYDRAVSERGSERKAQAVLEEREKRVAHFNIRTLSPAERDRYSEEWRAVQSQFVDDPKTAVIDADDMVMSIMKAQGYPMTEFQNYRAAHEIAVRHREGRANTEDLRQAMIYYRSLVEDLLNGRKPGGVREVA